MSQEKHQVTFNVKVLTNLDQCVKIAGNIPELGLWSVENALQLATNANDYPYWSNPVPIMVPKRTKLEFKIVIFEHGQLQRWENLPDGLNRKYKVRYPITQIHICETDPIVRDIVIERNEESYTSLEISQIVVKRKNKGGNTFNPFLIAASDQSFSSSSVRELISSSISPESDEEFFKEIPINTSFYQAPALELPSAHMKSRSEEQKIKDLYLQMRSQSSNRLWHTSTKYTFHDAFYDVHEDDLTLFEDTELVYILTLDLPVTINLKHDGGFEIVPNYSHELWGLFDHHDQEHKSRITWVGLHRQIPPDLREEIDYILITEYGCHLIYLPDDKYNSIKYQFKENLWVNPQQITRAGDQENFWNLYELASFQVAENIMVWFERGFVLIHNYQFSLVSRICTKQRPLMKFHLIFNCGFPIPDSKCLSPGFLNVLNSMLCATAISFQNHDDINSFVETVGRVYGGRLLSQSGYLVLAFYGRFIILNANANLKMEYFVQEKQKIYKKILKEQNLTATEGEIKEAIFASIECVSNKQRIQQNFAAIEQLLTESKTLRERVKFIQILKGNSSSDQSDEKFEKMVEAINDKFHSPIQIIYTPSDSSENLEVQESLSKAQIFIDLNHNDLHKSYINHFISQTQGRSILISNKHDQYSNLFTNFTVNSSWETDDLVLQMKNCIEIVLNPKDKPAIFYPNKLPPNYFEEWLHKSSLAVLKTNLLMRNAKIFNTHIFSKFHTYEVVLAACSRNFKKPQISDLPFKYANSTNKIFIFPFEALFKKEALEVMKLEGRGREPLWKSQNINIDIYDPIQKLARSESNIVIIITRKPKEFLDHYLGQIRNLHLLAENGFFYRNTNKTEWKSLSTEDLVFKQQILPVMNKYKKGLDEYIIKEQESSLKFEISEKNRSSFNELMLTSLSKEIAETLHEKEKFEVYVTENSVKVRPFGINKGTVTQIFLQKTFQERGKIGFVFCIGQSQGDEEIFAGVSKSLKMSQEIFTEIKHIFTCAIGHRPSHANYFVSTREEVKKLLSCF